MGGVCFLNKVCFETELFLVLRSFFLNVRLLIMKMLKESLVDGNENV